MPWGCYLMSLDPRVPVCEGRDSVHDYMKELWGLKCTMHAKFLMPSICVIFNELSNLLVLKLTSCSVISILIRPSHGLIKCSNILIDQ